MEEMTICLNVYEAFASKIAHQGKYFTKWTEINPVAWGIVSYMYLMKDYYDLLEDVSLDSHRDVFIDRLLQFKEMIRSLEVKNFHIAYVVMLELLTLMPPQEERVFALGLHLAQQVNPRNGNVSQ